MRVLLVQTDSTSSVALYRGLKDWYTVDFLSSDKHAFPDLDGTIYDVCIIDLPHERVLQVCRHLRQCNPNVPILILTPSLKVREQVQILDAGADDFLMPPFDFLVLRARIRALTRRGKAYHQTVKLAVGDIVMHLSERKAYHQEFPLDLRRKEFLLLEYFLRHPGRVVSRDTLLENVWDSVSDPLTNTVDVHIKFLRDKVDKPFRSHHIRTIHGLGYSFDLRHVVDHNS